MIFVRSSGILLHPTSLPGPYGIGDLGAEAHRFIDLLRDTAQSLWQVLPLGPTGYANSPYQSFSTFAGNPLLISIDKLIDEGFAPAMLRRYLPESHTNQIDYGETIPLKLRLLRRCFECYEERATPAEKERFAHFCDENSEWLEDYALFMALKGLYDEQPWTTWAPELINRQPAALAHWRQRLAAEIRWRKFLQYHFFRQWRELKAHCNRNGIKIVGDIPIFVAHDSADVWAHPELFQLDSSGNPTVVAGVPPDYFSDTGQLWGNPIYRWDRHAATGYSWWIKRIGSLLNLIDYIRLDHFRGFEKYWEIPAEESTAVKGRWVEGPGAGLFNAIQRELGKLPIIAEDLGVITPEVEALRDRFSFPGMKVLQFAFGHDPKMMHYLQHDFPCNCIIYTGTHDNDTTLGWFRGLKTKNTAETQFEQQNVLQYTRNNGCEFHWDLIEVAMRSAACVAIIPLQDLLGLGTEARMNLPGTTESNWEWRFTFEQLTDEVKNRLRTLTWETFRATR